MKQQRHVALAVRAGVPYLQDMIEAILIYGRQQGDWRITMGLEYWPVFSVAQLRGWKGDGVIAWINDRSEAQLLKRLRIPAVNVSAALERTPVPRVALDDYAVGRLAAEHLIARGFRRFAHYATAERWYARRRVAGFVETVRAAGGMCELLLASEELSDYTSLAAHEEELRRWLRGLRKPIGVFATHDHRAWKLTETCRQIGLRVPDDVSVIGVNNDLAVCENADPPLTSVARNGQAVGTAAAELLDRLMSAGPRPVEEILIPPDRVVPRRSTDLRPVDDPQLAAAVSYMREHLHEPINIGDVTAKLDVSRRSLERAFRKELDSTPHAYLCRLRIDRARQILSEQRNATMDDVARACGLLDARLLRKIFKRTTGVSPRRFRDHAAKEAASANRPDSAATNVPSLSQPVF